MSSTTATTKVTETTEATNAENNKENSTSQKKRRHSKKKTKEKLKEVNQNIQSNPGSSPPAHAVSPSGNSLLEELQKKSRINVRTGKVPVNEVMGPGYGQQSGGLKSQSNAQLGRSILQRLVGNNVDPEAIFSEALRQMPQVPGFPSISEFYLF
ncbi:hypothetical protein OESDEN_07818 [Oesophagostomum dentatum]|uniref:Uncharacterized protein n=1 Tax=Oesophagostomum dentatum TaxID=61180 RepID=A0A0B1TA89_OESDE|nr:hypothetical protein OESDEN_07818 [Oesophagostomum dentatum]